VTELWAADLDEGWPRTQVPAPHIRVTYGFFKLDRYGVEGNIETYVGIVSCIP
jgi:hypothetical protein